MLVISLEPVPLVRGVIAIEAHGQEGHAGKLVDQPHFGFPVGLVALHRNQNILHPTNLGFHPAFPGDFVRYPSGKVEALFVVR